MRRVLTERGRTVCGAIPFLSGPIVGWAAIEIEGPTALALIIWIFFGLPGLLAFLAGLEFTMLEERGPLTRLVPDGKPTTF